MNTRVFARFGPHDYQRPDQQDGRDPRSDRGLGERHVGGIQIQPHHRHHQTIQGQDHRRREQISYDENAYRGHDQEKQKDDVE